MHIAWHDGEDASLAAAGLALGEERQGRTRQWWLEKLGSGTEQDINFPRPPGVAPAILARANRPEMLGPTTLGHPLPAPLRTVARFEARRRTASIGGGRRKDAPGRIAIELLEGRLATSGAEQRLARLRFAGQPAAVFALADRLLADLPCAVPAASLAEEALGASAGDDAPRTGSPLLPEGLSAGDALAWLVATLARALLALAPRASTGEESEPVHQMRVALRRLRTAITVLKRLLPPLPLHPGDAHDADHGDGPTQAALTEVEAGLRTLARALGPAREWDVFLEGTGMAVAAAFPENAALARLLKAAARRREAAYDALRAELGSAGFRRLMLQLSSLTVLRPWQPISGQRTLGQGQQGAPEGRLEEDGPEPPLTAATVAELLQRRQRKLLAAAANIAHADAQHLHAIRLRAKRLRYAGELFSPLFPRKETQRFLRRLARLQDRLGIVNDAQAVDRLLNDLGAMGSGHAAGLVRGFVAANALRERARVEPAWRKFRRHAPFWH